LLHRDQLVLCNLHLDLCGFQPCGQLVRPRP
jgi:hypothetical protein